MSTLRPLSSALLAEFGLTRRRPGYLIEIGWPSGTTRSATFATITALGYTWNQHAVKVTGWSEDGTGKATCGLVFDNGDLEWSTLALGDAVSGVTVSIHQVYAGAAAEADIVQDWFNGELDGASMPQGGRALTLDLVRPGDSTLFVPRDVLGPAIGVNHLCQAGKTINIAGQVYTFQSSAR